MAVGVYRDYATPLPDAAAGIDLTAAFDAEQRYSPELLKQWDQGLEKQPLAGLVPASSKGLTTHLLAREKTSAALHQAVAEGRGYVSNDQLADPTGFAFVASNLLGIFQPGDRIPLFMDAKFTAMLPVAGKLRLIHNGKVVAESSGTKLEFATRELGYYRLEAWLEVGGELRPWIYSNPIWVTATAGLRLPTAAIPESIEVRRDVAYTTGAAEDEAKQKLDIYRPKGRKDLPVFLFVHGGSWRQGDRSQYGALASRLAQDGMVVVVPSYRLAPKNQHPAQIDDVRAAFRWTVAHLGEIGGDAARVYVGGHSAGGHLAALLGLTEPGIQGVAALSGVYDVSGIRDVFTEDAAVRRQASPLTHVKRGAPQFTITYCQWDYLALPQQAETFAKALKEAGVSVHLVYVSGESHISEIINASNEIDKTHQAITDLVR